MKKFYLSLAALAVLSTNLKAQNVFYIQTLGNAGPTITDMLSTAGDDRGGIALNQDNVYVTGDTCTAITPISLIGTKLKSAVTIDGIVCNISGNGSIYNLTNNGTPVKFFLNSSGSVTVNRLVQLNPTTLLPTGNNVNLSTPITLSNLGGNFVGIYSGPGYFILEDASDVYKIDFATGSVTQISSTFSIPVKKNCENGANWGVAEYDGTNYAVTYVKNSTSIESRYINATNSLRQSFNFTNLGDMCSMIISPWNNQWYFKYEGNAMFGGVASNGETLGKLGATYFGNLPLNISMFASAKQYNLTTALVSIKVGEEKNVAVYNVQKQNENGAYETIGNITPNGESNYTFEDNNAVAAKNTYRIEAELVGGEKEYSNVTTLFNKFKSEFTLQVLPNPVKDGIVKVHINKAAKSNTTVEIVNMNGLTLAKQEVSADYVEFDIKQLPKGMYLVKAYDNLSSNTYKIVKQ